MDRVTLPFRVGLRMRFRGVTERTGVLIEGPSGWGEFSPFPEYPPEVAARWLNAALEAAEEEWPEPVRSEIPVNVTVPAVGAEEAHELVAASGCSTAKVKVAEGDDEARLEAVRDALGPSGSIRIDVNGAWDTAAAIDAIKRFDRFDLEYVEQPCGTTEELAEVRRAVDVRIAADESIRLAHDPMEVVRLEAADVAILKVQPLGGVNAALALAERLGLPAVVSSALETSVGIAMGARLAACLPELAGACGLGTVALLERDVTPHPLLPAGGVIEVRRVVPDPSLIEEPGDPGALLERMAAAESAS